jgi:hypothetical protein
MRRRKYFPTHFGCERKPMLKGPIVINGKKKYAEREGKKGRRERELCT